MFQVAQEIRLLRAEIGKWGAAPPIPIPMFPGERIQKQHDAAEVSDLYQAIEEGQRNWKLAQAWADSERRIANG